jgi:enoyl-CoA hydratase
MQEDMIKGEKTGNVYTITINRPDKRNALTWEMVRLIAQLAEECLKDQEVRVIVLRGEGKMFSAGVDLASLGEIIPRYIDDPNEENRSGLRHEISKMQREISRLAEIEVPVICMMHNRVMGMANELALACDIRVMSDDCVWGLQEVLFGIMPDLGGTARLTRTVGSARAMEICMTGSLYTAPQALAWSYVNHVFPNDTYWEESKRLAATIAENAPLAVSAIKQTILGGAECSLSNHLDLEVIHQCRLFLTQDFKEGMASMLEKRPPVWKNC